MELMNKIAIHPFESYINKKNQAISENVNNIDTVRFGVISC